MLTVKDLIDELKKHPDYLPVQITRHRVDVDDVRFESNYVELRVENQEDFAPKDEFDADLEETLNEALDILDDMAALILKKKVKLAEKDEQLVTNARQFLAEHL